MRTAAWIMMLGVQIPVVIATIYLFWRVLNDKSNKNGNDEEK